jgi:glucose/arabinose dehydrogenase
MNRARWCSLAAAAVFVTACSKSSPPASQTPSGAQQITGKERIGWTQPASDPAELSTFEYAIYVDDARSVLTSVSCASVATSDAGFDCSAALPSMSPGVHTLAIAAFVDAVTVVESGRSSPLSVVVVPAVTGSAVPTSADAAPHLVDGTVVSTTDGVRLRIDVVATALDRPTDLAATPDGRILVAERAGRIRIVRDGVLQPEPALVLDDAVTAGQSGLLAIAVDSHFAVNHFVYAVYTAAGRSGPSTFRLARFREARDTLADRAILLDEIPAAPSSPAAALRVGDDGKLLAAFDDGWQPAAAGDLARYNGKVLRLNPDATTPDDQAGGTPVFAYPYLSPAGIGVQAVSMWIADRLANGTRLTAVNSGSGRPKRATVAATYTVPALHGASGVASYRGTLIPAFRNDLLIASRDDHYVLRVRFDPGDATRIVSTERLLQDAAGPIDAVLVDPAGTIYFCTDHELARLSLAQ